MGFILLHTFFIVWQVCVWGWFALRQRRRRSCFASRRPQRPPGMLTYTLKYRHNFMLLHFEMKLKEINIFCLQSEVSMLAFCLQRMHLTPRLAENLNPNGSPPSSRLSSLSPPQQFPWHRRQEIVCISKRHSKTDASFSIWSDCRTSRRQSEMQSFFFTRQLILKDAKWWMSDWFLYIQFQVRCFAY